MVERGREDLGGGMRDRRECIKKGRVLMEKVMAGGGGYTKKGDASLSFIYLLVRYLKK